MIKIIKKIYKKSLDIIHDNLSLDVEILGDKRLGFNKKIERKCISFQYDIPNTLLDSLSLTIDKGDSIAIIGGWQCKINPYRYNNGIS